MITLSDAILAINPDAVFEYDDIDNISWRNRTKPIRKEDILEKYKELKDIEKEKIAFEKANKKGPLGKIIATLDNNKIYLYKYRQALATSSVLVSLIFVLTENFHKVRYTILTDPYGIEFVYDRFTGKIKKKINY
ncbi:MAG: hypothetical protein CFH34_01429 [Alphaproteobacteria bacterium MarineAlpha9_Bin4]|nr:hypothetical protein [Pelagibacterales bacterium]PPR25468.1 MAG: hypothetical protein CFH34_01429 [Alphaproteobacteria bacterium MarineAlpha9_Bin4]|tara:strand:+ start:862 stop:1266 length:405 start_codon:yes stop_codon:yes gene_type:complete